MRIIRFIDQSGNIRLGESEDGEQADVLQGDLYTGLMTTGEETRCRSC